MPVETHPDEGIALRASELQQAVSAGKYWRQGCYGLGLLLGMAIVGCVVLGSMAKSQGYPIEVDRCSGDVKVTGYDPRTYTPPQLVLHTTVRHFVEGLRTVSTDQEITKQHWRALEHQTTQKGMRLLLTYKDEYQPLQRRDPVKVTNIQVYPRSESSFYVRWVELVYSGKSPQREQLSMTPYSGLFTIERRRPVTAEEREDAPLGIFFDDWNFQKGA